MTLSPGDEPGLVIRSILIKTYNYFSRSLAISSGKSLKVKKAGLAFCQVGLICKTRWISDKRKALLIHDGK